MQLRTKLLKEYKDFTALMEQKSYRLCDELVRGISYLGLGTRLENIHQVDQNKWIILENKDEGYASLQPNINNEEFYKLYQKHYPRQSLSYDQIIDLVICEKFTPEKPDFSITVLPDRFALIATEDYQPQPGLKRISHKKYRDLIAIEGSIEFFH